MLHLTTRNGFIPYTQIKSKKCVKYFVAGFGNLCKTTNVARRIYDIQITVNNQQVEKVVIDPHYEVSHADSINDDIILHLVKQLDRRTFEADDTDGAFSYFVTDGMIWNGKKYKLVWLLENNEIYIGVVNAYRR